MTGFSVEKDGSMSGGLEDWATSAGKAFGKAKKLFSVVTTGFEDFQNLDEAIRGSGTSFNDFGNNSDYLQKARKYGHFTGYKN